MLPLYSARLYRARWKGHKEGGGNKLLTNTNDRTIAFVKVVEEDVPPSGDRVAEEPKRRGPSKEGTGKGGKWVSGGDAVKDSR